MVHVAIDIQSVVGRKTGVGQFTYHFVKALPQVDRVNRYTLFLFDFRRRFQDTSLQTHNVTVKKLRFPGRVARKSWDLFSAPAIDRLVGEAHLFHFPNYILPPLASSRAVTTIYDVSFLRYPQYAQPETLRWLSKNIRKTVDRAIGIITVSEFSKSEIVRTLGAPAERIRVVYPGVSASFRVAVPPEGRQRVRREYGLPEDYILCVGTLEPRKNLLTLVQAFDKARAFFRKERCRLVLAGVKGWKMDPLFEWIRRQGLKEDVVLTGYVEDRDLPALYQGAAYLVFPSFYEGFGMPIIEAMASAIPVIASGVESHREILGEAAVFINPNDVDGLARSMKDLYQDADTRRQLVEKAAVRVAAFTWEACARGMIECYEHFAGNRI